MPITVMIHLPDEEPVVGEIEELPEPTAQMILVANPRLRDGKDLHYLARGVVNVIWPFHRINFIQVMTTEEEERIIGFVRE